MDIQKKPKKKKSSAQILLITAVLIMIVAIVWNFFYSSKHHIQKSNTLFSFVQSGNLDITVDGYGALKSNKQQLITAQNAATVTEIIMKPGQYVDTDSVILRLENVDLINELESAELELKFEESNLRELILNQQRELLEEQSKHAQLIAEYEAIKYQRKSTESLMISGTVSKLDYVKLELEEKQLNERVTLQEKSLQQLSSIHKEAVNIQNEKIGLKRLKANAINQKVSDLTVKAGYSGVIQKLPLELGQTLAKGEQIALIGDDKDLLASIQVPQSKIHLVEVGLPVVIDTRHDEIKGTVTRIEPGVLDNYVTIEVGLPQNLPSSARPELNVDALITIQSIENALYIERPINIEDNSSASLFKYDEDSGSAQKTKLIFGAGTGRFVEIKSGANLNDVFIISDLSTIKSDTITVED